MPAVIHLDFETFSEQDLRAVGQYRYAMDSSTEVLIACYAFDDSEIHTWLPWREKTIPEELLERAQKDQICAHVAAFEAAIWDNVLCKKHGAPIIPPSRWICTAARASMCGLPRSLEGATKAMFLPTKVFGGNYIKRFCIPQKDGSRIYPRDDWTEFKGFIRYCKQDVVAERGLHKKLPMLPEFEQRVFATDMLINARGLPIDTALVQKAIVIVGDLEKRVQKRVRKITKGINPTQRDKILAWLEENGVELENLQAQTVRNVLKQADELEIDPKIRTLLELRVEAARVSTKKLLSMMRVAVLDRMRGIFLYYGAHTGRWSGKLVQPHNFIRGLLSLVEQTLIFDMLRHADADIFEMIFKWPLSSISQCMRGFIKAPKGYRFIIVDYSAIERRVAAWLANERWVLKAYAEGKDLYVMLAAHLFGVAEEDVTEEQRRIAKNIELGCIYQMSGKKFIVYCAKQDIVIEEQFGIDAVETFRQRNPKTKKMWWRVEEAAISAVLNPKERFEVERLSFFMDGRFLCIELPSKRCLYYPFPKVETVKRYGKLKAQLSYRTDWKGGKWMRIGTYGGKLFENIVQGVSRDFMAHGMILAEEAGYHLVGTVHDEQIAEKKIGYGSAEEMARVVCQLPNWGSDCPLTAKGFEAVRYRKG